MSEQAIARRLLDTCRRRLSGADIELCEAVIDGRAVNDMKPREWQSWSNLCTEFAADLADMIDHDQPADETSTATLI